MEAEERGKEESVNFEDILLVIRPSESTCFCHHFLPLFLSVTICLSIYLSNYFESVLFSSRTVHSDFQIHTHFGSVSSYILGLIIVRIGLFVIISMKNIVQFVSADRYRSISHRS